MLIRVHATRRREQPPQARYLPHSNDKNNLNETKISQIKKLYQSEATPFLSPSIYIYQNYRIPEEWKTILPADETSTNA